MRKEYDQALETCQSILDIQDNPEVHYNMGHIKKLKGEFEGALISFKKATVTDPLHAVPTFK